MEAAEEVLTEVGNRAVEIWNRLIPIAIIAAVGWILIVVCRFFIHRAEKRRGDLHLSFFQHLITGVILIVCVIMALSSLNGLSTMWRTLLSGTAVFTAVLAFVAQDVIKDVLAGLMLTVHRQFALGDRVVLEDGTVGVVQDITMRYVVLTGIDSQHIYVPNSKISAMKITNFITPEGNQSIHFKFSVGYESDMDLVKQVIARAIEDCPDTIPGRVLPDGTESYGPVSFLSFADSALIMSVTVYYPRAANGMAVIDDVNCRVRDGLRKAGIEIPYNYVTVVTEQPKQEAAATN